MNGPGEIIDHESRWAPALAVGVVLAMLILLPDHVHVLPAWVLRLLASAMLGVMLAVGLTKGNTLWLKVERSLIIVIAGVYVLNTIVELVDMVGLVTLHPGSANAFSLLSSSVAIWTVNVLTFSLLYWQIDRGGPYARACKLKVKPDWVFPQPATPEDLPPDWRPLFFDYLYLGYNTATAFSPTATLPLTHRAKMLMMIESTISLLTMVVVLSHAINVIPS